MAHKATNVIILRDVSISMNGPADTTSPATAGVERRVQKAEQAAVACNAIVERLERYAKAHPGEAVNVAQIDFGDEGWSRRRAGGHSAPLQGTTLAASLQGGITVYDFTPVEMLPVFQCRAVGGNTPLYSAVATALDLCRETDNLAGNSAHLVILLTDGFAGDARLAVGVKQALHDRLAVGGWTVCYIFLGKVGANVCGTTVTTEMQAEVLGLDQSMVYAGSDLLGTPGLLKGLDDFLAAREHDAQAIDHWFTDTITTENAEDALEAIRMEEAR